MATVTLLQLKSDFWAHQNQLWQSTATGGSTTSLIDTSISNLISELYPTPVVNRQLRITSGASSGDLRQVARVDEIRSTLFPSGAGFSSTGPANGDSYELWGNGIHGGKTHTTLFNDTCRRLRPVTQSQVTIVTGQQIYDVSTLFPDKDDLRAVRLRLVDPANLRPYSPTDMKWWDCYELSGGTSGGTSQRILNLGTTLTNQGTVQLWLEYFTTLPVFTADTDTIDAIYRDWIAWEAILTYVRRAKENVSSDHKVWEQREQRALRELQTLRQRFIPIEPIVIRPQIPLP